MELRFKWIFAKKRNSASPFHCLANCAQHSSYTTGVHSLLLLLHRAGPVLSPRVRLLCTLAHLSSSAFPSGKEGLMMLPPPSSAPAKYLSVDGFLSGG